MLMSSLAQMLGQFLVFFLGETKTNMGGEALRNATMQLGARRWLRESAVAAAEKLKV